MANPTEFALELRVLSALYGLAGESVTTPRTLYGIKSEQARLLEVIEAAGLGSGGTPADRTTLTLTTPSLAAGAQHSATLTPGAVFTLLLLTVSAAARVRLYKSTAARTADATRVRGESPADGVAPYLILDASLPLDGALTLPLDVTGSSIAEDGQVFILVDNTGTVSAAIETAFTHLVLEPAEVI